MSNLKQRQYKTCNYNNLATTRINQNLIMSQSERNIYNARKQSPPLGKLYINYEYSYNMLPTICAMHKNSRKLVHTSLDNR